MENDKKPVGFQITGKLMENAFAGVLMVWLVSVIGIPLLAIYSGFRLEQFALLGDSLGMINALFSALAVMLVIAGLHEQQKEIAEIQKSAERTRLREMRAATPIFEVVEWIGPIPKSIATFHLKNIGATIFDIRWTCENHLVQVIDTPSIIGQGSMFFLSLNLNKLSDGELTPYNKVPLLKLRMDFVDSEGNERSQKFSCILSHYKGFKCSDHGIGHTFMTAEAVDAE